MSIFASHIHTHEALKSVGYLTTPDVSTVIFQAARLNRPILLEGPAGAGKTQLALSVASAEGLRFVRLQCYEGITDKQAIGDYNRALQDLYVLMQSKGNMPDWHTIRKEILSREFYSAGPLLDALESTNSTR
jgi:MoxR-like ATPase